MNGIKVRTKITSSNMRAIIAINAAAAKKGMSYGNYVPYLERQHKLAEIKAAKARTRKAVKDKC